MVWLKQRVKSYKHKLAPEDAINFGLAELDYLSGDYGEALGYTELAKKTRPLAK